MINYTQWPSEKWGAVLSDAARVKANPVTTEQVDRVVNKMNNMTYHERRLFIRKLLKDKCVHYTARQYAKLNVPSDRPI